MIAVGFSDSTSRENARLLAKRGNMPE